LVGELGRGGMGVVYLARQLRLNRQVALKVILAGDHAGPEQRVRFLAEAEAAAAVDHPGVVRVYECGAHAGQPYLTLEYCPGGTLADRLAAPLPPQEAAELAERLARAVAAAHAQGVLHRDLKPANVLFAADGAPKVADFGLARRAGGGLTQTGAILGTPSYMAPEQARGDKRVTAAADVYSLGAILYDCLIGRPPFRAESPLETLRQVQEAEPVSPSSLQPGLPRDLETVCLKCLEKDPAKRYAGAGELADDLGRWLAGEPVLARPVGRLERAWRWARRRPAEAGLLLAAGVAALLLAGGAVGLWYHGRLQEEYGRTREANEQLQRANEQLERLQYALNIGRAHAALRDGNLAVVDPLLDACPPDRRGWEWNYLKRLAHAELVRIPGLKPLSAWRVSPDGSRVALVTPSGEVKVCDTATGRDVRTLAVSVGAAGGGVAFSPDGARLAASSGDQVIRVWDLATGGEVLSLRGHTGNVGNVVFSPDGRWLASTSFAEECVRVWDAATGLPRGEPLRGPTESLGGFPGAVVGLAFSPDSTRLAAPIRDGTVYVWDVATGAIALTLKSHGWDAWGVAFSRDGARLATAGWDRSVKVWDVGPPPARGTRLLHDFRGHPWALAGVAFSPDGARLAVGTLSGMVSVRDIATGEELFAFTAHTGDCRLEYHPDGTRLVTGGGGWVKVWDAVTDPAGRTLARPPGRTGGGVLSPDGRRYAFGNGLDRTGTVIDAATGRTVLTLTGHTGWVGDVVFSPDRAIIASASSDRTVLLWDAGTGRKLRTLAGRVTRVAFSPDGGRLVSVSVADRTARIWDVAEGRELRPLRHEGGLYSVAVSPDGRLVATGDDAAGRIRVWDADTGREVYPCGGDGGTVWDLAFSPDGRWLASAHKDGAVRVWDAASGGLLRTLRGHTFFAQSVTFTPDGTRLASAGRDGTVKIWDPAAEQDALLTLRFHPGELPRVTFSPDPGGSLLYLNTSAGAVKVFDARPWPGAGP
jgi:WD40 repeat protein